MRTLIDAFEGFDESGLDPLERALRIQRRTIMLRRMIGNGLFTAHVCRGQQKPTLPLYLNGFTLENVISWLNNADARLQVLQRLDPSVRALFCERAISSDHNEGLFAYVVSLCGGKPTVHTLQGVERRLGYLLRVKQASREERGFSFRKRRTRGGYHQHGLEAGGVDGVMRWNAGLKVEVPALKLKRCMAIVKRVHACVNGKCGSLRSVIFNRMRLGTGAGINTVA